MRRAVLIAAAAAGLVWGSFGSLLDAQTGTGNIYGKVVDEQNAVLPGVVAELSGCGARQGTTSDSTGAFHFLNLAPCSYSVALSLSGFATVNRENVVVTLAKNTEFTVTMKISAVAATVEVSGETPIIDTRKTETGSTFSQAELRDIPTGRDPWVLLQQTPGVLVDRVNVGGSESGQQSGFVGKGSAQSTYNVDGVPVSDTGSDNASPIYFDFDSFQEVQIATGGSDLTLQSPGVTLNMVTKRGTNEIKGSARFIYAPQQWQSSNTPGEASAQGFQTDRIQFVREWGAEAGGPLLKDRAWLWGAAERNDINLIKTGTISADTGKPVHNDTVLESWNAKLSLMPTDQDSGTLFYLRSDKVVDGRDAGPTRPQETTFHQDGPTTLLKVEDSHVASSSLVADAFGSYMESPFRLIPLGGVDTDTYRDPDGIWHFSYGPFKYDTFQHQARGTLSAFFNTGKIGHELKFGFGYRHTTVDSYSAWPGTGVFADDFSGVVDVTRPANLKYQVQNYDAYLSDTLTADRLTVNVGARYDYQEAKNLPSVVPANGLFPDILPSVSYAGDKGYPIQWKDLEPRIGVTYAVGPEKKTLLRGSYSRFADQLTNQIFRGNAFPLIQYLYFYNWVDKNGDHRVEPGELDVTPYCSGTDCSGASSANLNPSNTASPFSPNVLSSHYVAPKTDEFIVGVDHELLPNFAVSANYTYRHIRDLSYSNATGATAGDYEFAGNATGTVVGANGTTLNFNEPFYTLTLDPLPVGKEFHNRPGADETYQGVELQAVKRLSHGWMLRGSFAYNDWRQHLSSSSILDPNNLLGGTNADDGLVVVQGSSGKSDVYINSKWQFNVSGLYQLPWGVNFAANFFGRQGYALPYYVRIRGIDDPTDGTSRPHIQIGDVATHRLNNVYELDLRVEKTFPIGPAAVSAAIDCFNVMNDNTILQRDIQAGTYRASNNTFTPSATFNQIEEVQSPRIFRASIRVSF